jgi:hypothetical protein
MAKSRYKNDAYYVKRGADTAARVKTGGGEDPSHGVPREGHADFARVLLGYSTDDATAQAEYETTPLPEAPCRGHMNLESPSQARGRSNDRVEQVDSIAWGCRQPLHRAPERGHVELARVLLDRGADAIVLVR